MSFEGTSALVTGASSGLGEAVAHALSTRGARVVIADINETGGDAVAKDVGGIAIKVDVADPEQVAAAIKAASRLGPLRTLVNCAGVGLAMRTVSRAGEPHDLGEFDRIVRTNLLGTFNCVRLAAAEMMTLDPAPSGARGSIVNTASVAATDGQIGQAAYAASKAGITGMTLPLARDLSTAGIRVNTIAPGLIDTPIYGTGAAADQFKSHLAENVPFPHRLGTSQEFASMAIELIVNSYMNGEVVRIDGALRLPPK